MRAHKTHILDPFLKTILLSGLNGIRKLLLAIHDCQPLSHSYIYILFAHILCSHSLLPFFSCLLYHIFHRNCGCVITNKRWWHMNKWDDWGSIELRVCVWVWCIVYSIYIRCSASHTWSMYILTAFFPRTSSRPHISHKHITPSNNH